MVRQIASRCNLTGEYLRVRDRFFMQPILPTVARLSWLLSPQRFSPSCITVSIIRCTFVVLSCISNCSQEMFRLDFLTHVLAHTRPRWLEVHLEEVFLCLLFVIGDWLRVTLNAFQQWLEATFQLVKL